MLRQSVKVHKCQEFYVSKSLKRAIIFCREKTSITGILHEILKLSIVRKKLQPRNRCKVKNKRAKILRAAFYFVEF